MLFIADKSSQASKYNLKQELETIMQSQLLKRCIGDCISQFKVSLGNTVRLSSQKKGE